MYKSIDLFAGIGGIRKGFDRAFGENINTVFVSEWDEYAQKTYKLNYHDRFDIAGDITKIDEKEIPDFDICLADSHVRHSRLQENVWDLMMIIRECAEELYFRMLSEYANITNLKLFFVKMLKD